MNTIMPKKGVKIFLKTGTPIPKWIRNQNLNIAFVREKFYGGRKIRTLRIKKGGAAFTLGGEVAVKMPGSGEYWEAFRSGQVLEIRDFTGNLVVEKDHHLCTMCGALTGKMSARRSNPNESFTEFQCNECGYRYKVKM